VVYPEGDECEDDEEHDDYYGYYVVFLDHVCSGLPLVEVEKKLCGWGTGRGWEVRVCSDRLGLDDEDDV
jgi:hypothetical protein